MHIGDLVTAAATLRTLAGRLGAIATLLGAGLAAPAGCFYVEPINQRPSLDIRPTSSDPVFRGATVTFEAVASDPEKHAVALLWRVYTCTDAIAMETCDGDLAFTGAETEATFRVPPFRADPDGPGPEPAPPVESLRVVLAGSDDLGAAARPEQVLVIPVLNAPPSLAVRVASKHGAVVSTPIDVYARFGDPDDTPENVALEWTAFSPSQVPGALVDVPVPPDGDPSHLQQGKRFTPQVTGNWDLRVVATDRLGTTTEQHLIITVADDAPPCLDAWEPVASATPAPITDPTLFRVIQVRDDLDAFPRTSSEAFIGEPAFAWSIQVGAGPRQALSNPVNSLAFDPQAYAPGTILELRVEIFDRRATGITCADGAPTCSVISQLTCIQRQTWRVEAR